MLRNLIDLLILAALWGGSFLFLRIAVPEFGPLPLVELRVAIAGLFLLPALWLRYRLADIKETWRTCTCWLPGTARGPHL